MSDQRVDLCQADGRTVSLVSRDASGPRVAVTPAQYHIVRCALAFWMERGRWPASFELAAYADRSCPDVWAELKTLERLGITRWRRTVRVLREPSGLFYLPKTTVHPALSEPSRDGEPVANMYGASCVAGASSQGGAS